MHRHADLRLIIDDAKKWRGQVMSFTSSKTKTTTCSVLIFNTLSLNDELEITIDTYD